MSNRKETPDVLGEILSGPAKSTPSATPVPISVDPKAEPAPAPKATPSKTLSKPERRSTSSKQSVQWTYMEVIFREFRGWRPRFVDGVELDDWKDQPEIADYLNLVGQEGWEMVGIVNSRRNMRDAYFKRRAE